MGSDLTVNRDRLWNTLMQMGQICALGQRLLPLSPERRRQARQRSFYPLVP